MLKDIYYLEKLKITNILLLTDDTNQFQEHYSIDEGVMSDAKDDFPIFEEEEESILSDINPVGKLVIIFLVFYI